MTITVLPVIVPKAVLVAGVSGVASRQNLRTRNQGGYGSVNAIRDATMRAWQVGTGPMKLSDAEDFFGLYEVTDAGAFGMLLEDPIDSTVTAANGALQGYMAGVEFGTPGFGNGCPTYGLRKQYTAKGTALTRARALTRPNSIPAVTRGGTPVTYGAGAGQIAASAGPVYITFVPDATRTITGVSVGATTQITLSSAIPGLVIGGRLWLQGLGGTHAALLNSLSHSVTNISGGSLNVYTIATDTAGKSISTAGQGHKYPQPDEALSWSGSFYVPVNFRDDNLDWDLVVAGPAGKRMVQIPSCFLDEIREA